MPRFAWLPSGFASSDDVQAVLGIALTGGCTSWTSFAEKAENG
ncbi:hypothetical protein T03_8541 [Trichinella britovi]|uniref:Uncharacterized protein n=1 Tax=Trichinella britovi TaxID=45882 RepID=A0A0V1AH21_TRIBR|nr:hypothetical protein T03_8541 [Trichinella britovi]